MKAVMVPKQNKPQKSSSKPRTSSRVQPASHKKPAPEIVDPRWLLKMLGITLAAALVCGYITVAVVFYFTSWQLVLHPTHNAGGGTGLPTQHVQFDVDASGKPRLSGEWYPAAAGASHANYAVLYLRSGDGQLDAADGTQIAMLHDLGINVFAFDYSGYGSSVLQPHPSEKQMLQDADHALGYMAARYQFRDGQAVVFGSGTGVSIAAQIAQANHNTAGLIGYNADPEVLARVKADRRGDLFPIALFHDRFSLDALNTLKKPKLLYTVGPASAARTAVYRNAADPKLTIEVPTHDAAAEQAALTRFLDTYLSASPQTLTH